MSQTKFIQVDDGKRAEILSYVGLESDTALALAVEAALRKAQNEHATLPEWYPLGGRNAAAISALRMALEVTGCWTRWQHRNLHGVKHLQTGRFIAVHNCCERTGLDLAERLPRFMSDRKRSATKSLRDDLQGDLDLLIEDEGQQDSLDARVEMDMPAHLCVYINSETLATGEAKYEVRAELLIDGECNDAGFTSARYRLPIDLEGLVDDLVETGMPNGARPGDGGVFEADVSIRKRS